MNLYEIQKEIYQNKVNKGFNVTNVNMEFCLIYGEVSEAYEAWRKKLDSVGEELADVAIYLLGLSEILHINLEDAVKNSSSEDFDSSSTNKAFCALYCKVCNAYASWDKGEDISEKIASIFVHLSNISKALGFNLEKEIEKKVAVNRDRTYKVVDGVLKRTSDH